MIKYCKIFDLLSEKVTCHLNQGKYTSECNKFLDLCFLLLGKRNIVIDALKRLRRHDYYIDIIYQHGLTFFFLYIGSTVPGPSENVPQPATTGTSTSGRAPAEHPRLQGK